MSDRATRQFTKASLGIAAALCVGAIAIWVGQVLWPRPVQVDEDARGANRIKGGADRLPNHSGRLVVLVYSDFQCPFCKEFAIKIEPVLRLRYEASGSVVWAQRHMPLDDIHPAARAAAGYQICAAKWGKGDAMSAEILRVPGQLYSHLPEIAKGLNLGSEAFGTCLKSTAVSVLASDESEVQALGLRATPTVVLARPRGHDLVVIQAIEGARPLDVFAELIEALLTRPTTGGDDPGDPQKR